VTGVIEDFFRRRDEALSKMPRELILHVDLMRLKDDGARNTIREGHDGQFRIAGQSSRGGRMEAARTTDQDQGVACDPATAPLASRTRHRVKVDRNPPSGGRTCAE
jgi:hypothetical protein